MEATMELTIFLSKVFGIWAVLTAVAVLMRQGYYASVFANFSEQQLTLVIVSMLELLGGLFLIFGHWVWEPLAGALVTVMGLMMVVEGSAYLFMPAAWVAKLIGIFCRTPVYMTGGIVWLAFGSYLLAYGFGYL
jgi:hypothetical protein